MLANPKSVLMTIAAGCVLFAHPAMAADGVTGNLVTVAWLEKNLHNVANYLVTTYFRL